jgi:cell division GTPase FtsZ
VVRQAATDDTNIIFGATIDDRLAGQVWVTVVATGLGNERGRRTFAATGTTGGTPDFLEPPSFLEDLS